MRDLEKQLAKIARLRADPHSEEALRLLREALSSKVSLVVAKAAQVAREGMVNALVPDLVASFARFFGAPVRADTGCHAKTAIVHALRYIGDDPPGIDVSERVFLPGAHYVQMEPVRDGKEDTADDLRAACAAGLVGWNHPAAIEVLADHLADRERRVRIAAASTLGQRGRGDAVPLLRLRVAMGDDDASVIGQCFRALLGLAPETAVPFVARHLNDDIEDTLFLEAALALGESRIPSALAALRASWDLTFDGVRRGMLLDALAESRRDEALAFVIERIEEDATNVAIAAVRALASLRADEALRRRVAQAVDARGDADVAACFAEVFGKDGA